LGIGNLIGGAVGTFFSGRGRGGEGKGLKESGREMEGLLIRGERGGEKGKGGSPGYYGSPESRAARIATGCDTNECHY